MSIVFRYLFRVFMVRFVFLLIGIGAVLQLLDLLANSTEVLAGEGNDVTALYRYILLRSPQLITTIVPFTVLLAGLITFTGFAQHSEVIVLKASGLSPLRILRPLILGAGIIGIIHFSFNETIVISSTMQFRAWENQDFAADANLTESSSSIWMTDGPDRVHARSVGSDGTRLIDVRIVRVDETNRVTTLTTAAAAEYRESSWTLLSAEVWNAIDNSTRMHDTLAWDTGADPGSFLFLAVRPDEVSFAELARHVTALGERGGSVEYFVTWLHQKVSGPLGAMIMPLFAALVGFGIYRGGALTLRFLAGLGMGFGFFVVVNLMIALGTYGTVPPVLAAWFPFLLFLCLGAGIVVYEEA